MIRLRDLPIQRKMLVIALILCGAVLLLATLVLLVFQVVSFRQHFRRDTQTLAAIIGQNATAVLAFDDHAAAQELMQSMQAKPDLVAGVLWGTNGVPIAHYGPTNLIGWPHAVPEPGQFRDVHGHLLYHQPVLLDGRVLGSLMLSSNYRTRLMQMLVYYAVVIAGVFLAAFLLASWLARYLQRSITEPVLALAQTARQVGEHKDYSLRTAHGARGDELGQLTLDFNHMLSRIQEQDAALSLSQRKLEALVHSIDGIVWECSPGSERFTFVSRQTERILGYDVEAWLREPSFWQSKLHPEDAAQAVACRRRMFERRQPYRCEYRMLAADGRTLWIRESGVVLAEQDRPFAIRGILQDITDQKAAAEKLDQLNRQVQEASRLAGMAEVATGVLHNVGNVLNSVNVSATLIADRVRSAPIMELTQVVESLKANAARLPEFLVMDPMGQQLPQYVEAVQKVLVEEQKELLQESGQLRSNVEHIKEIVAMQQTYARTVGCREIVAASELLENAVRLHAAALARHGVTVRWDAASRALVHVDRHKTLQILLNLVANAKQALDAGGSQEKQLTLRVGTTPQHRALIEVEDNGVGIAPDHLTRIFARGFTTRAGGHGFGLHMSALSATEMGGSLRVSSAGLGHGACFTLELPLHLETPNEPHA